VSAVSDDGQPV